MEVPGRSVTHKRDFVNRISLFVMDRGFLR
jgi:hypothetical protein